MMTRGLLLAAGLLTATVGSAWAGDYEPRTRHYYIAAEKGTWDYAPSGKNRIHPGEGLGAWGKQRIYQKTRYIEYTDGSFTEKAPRPDWLGILGPVIRGVVGDTIKIHFKNKADRPYSIHPIGTFYTKSNEGAAYAGLDYPGQAVAPGETYTYTLKVTPAVGPGPNDPSSILRLYRSHVDPVNDVYRGLVGPILLTRADAAAADGTPENVDRAFVTMFMVFDENEKGETAEGDLMHGINGRIFGNLRGLTMKQGEKVRWHVFAMGSEVDLHTPHWHGNGVMHHGHRKESLLLQPAITRTVDMKASNPGTWLFKCNVADHVDAGMMTLYKVRPNQGG